MFHPGCKRMVPAHCDSALYTCTLCICCCCWLAGGGAACTTVKMNPNAHNMASSSTGSAKEAVQESWQTADKHVQPTEERQTSSTAASAGAPAKVPAEVLDEMQHSLALIASQPQAIAGSKAVLQKLLSNLLAAPQVSTAGGVNQCCT